MTLGRCVSQSPCPREMLCRAFVNQSFCYRFRFDVLNFHTTVEWGLLVAYTASLDTIYITDTKLPAEQSEANHNVCTAGYRSPRLGPEVVGN